MRAIYFLFALASLLGNSAAAQTTSEPSIVDSICSKHFPPGAVYSGAEYRDGRNIIVTIAYTDCIDIGSKKTAPKVMLTFDRQEAGNALRKGQWLEFAVEVSTDSANPIHRLKWLNFGGFYREKSRVIVLNRDGSYVEQLVYMTGTKDDVTYRRKN